MTSMKSQNRRKNARGFSIFSEILGREANAYYQEKYHSYLSYRGIKEDYIYILKEGVVKTSVIMRDGREFNFSYLKATDIVSLLRDEVSNYTDSPFNVRVETAEASFYRIPRVKFWTFVKEKRNCKITYGIIIAINCLRVWNPSST